MTILFDDNLIAVWHCFIPQQPGQAESDFMAALSRSPGGGFKLVYRFRYYKDDKAFNSKDHKNWYGGELPPGDEAAAIDQIRQVVAVLTEVGGGPRDEVLRNGMDTDSFLAALTARPWAHFQATHVHDAGHA